MAIVAQNDLGTVTNANSYIEVAYADNYFVEKNDETWDNQDQEVKEAALIAATRYFDNVNRGKIKGNKLTRAQNTQFPRDNLFDEDGFEVEGIPENLKMGIAEYAIRAISNSLAPDPAYNDNGLYIKSIKEKVGPLEDVITYQDAAIKPTTIRKYPEADMFVEWYIVKANFIMRA